MSRLVALDSNLLLLYATGTHARAAIPDVRRLRAYSVVDFEIVVAFLQTASGLVLTPNTVTETSNLLHLGPRTRHHEAIQKTLTSLLARFGEKYIPSLEAFGVPGASNLGVTDAVMLLISRSGATLLTADLDLYLAATKASLPAINFNYMREAKPSLAGRTPHRA